MRVFSDEDVTEAVKRYAKERYGIEVDVETRPDYKKLDYVVVDGFGYVGIGDEHEWTSCLRGVPSLNDWKIAVDRHAKRLGLRDRGPCA